MVNPVCCTCLCSQVQTVASAVSCACCVTDMLLTTAAINRVATNRCNCYTATGLLAQGVACKVPNGQMIFVCDALLPVVNVNCCWIGVDGRCMTTTLSRTLWSWGFNAIGDNTSISRSSPVREITRSTTWCTMSAGDCVTTAIKTDGTLWSWGTANGSGQLADNTTIGRSSPVREITSSTTWCQIGTSINHSAAIKTDGTLWAWGYNLFNGSLGDGSKTTRSSPVQEICSGTTWCRVGTGSKTSVALKTDGSLWTWGLNSDGQLADNSTDSRCSPGREITSNTTWCQIGVGLTHVSALRTNGSLWAWGCNANGRLGDNTTTNRSSPVQEITSSTNWCQVAGNNHTAALKTDGSLWTWGFNSCGNLGDLTIIDRSSPIQEITSSKTWYQVTSGRGSTLSVKTDGTIWAWGGNNCGKLGDNTTITRSSPVREVTSSTNWCLVSAGNCHATAIKLDASLSR